VTAWLKQNWKLLLAVVAGSVIVILLYLRSRASGAPASQITFPAPTAGGSAGGDTGSNPAPAAAVQTLLTATGAQTGLFADPSTTATVTWVPGGTKLVSAGPPVQGKFPFGATSGFWAQSNWWQPVLYQGQTLYVWAPFTLLDEATQAAQQALSSLTGVGGPGLIYGNLQRASLAAQAAAHRAALVDPRRSARIAQQGMQAAAESRRMFAVSRGAAPVGGPGTLLPLGGRRRWRR